MFDSIINVFKKHGYEVKRELLVRNHKLLSETIRFPDKTSQEFYQEFNANLCLSLGIPYTEKILGEIFESCSYLPWEKFSDTDIIDNLGVNLGIISNWDASLNDKLMAHFNYRFNPIIGSENTGVKKPNTEIFKLAEKALDKQNSSILYIGDSIKLDMLPAIEVGWDAILIDRENIFEHYSNRINSLSELLK